MVTKDIKRVLTAKDAERSQRSKTPTAHLVADQVLHLASNVLHDERGSLTPSIRLNYLGKRLYRALEHRCLRQGFRQR